MKYTVQQGDTLYGIAKRYSIPFADLVSLNPQIADPDQVYPGQVIQVPGSEAGDAQQTNRTNEKAVLAVAAKLDELVKELGDFPGTAGKKVSSGRPAVPRQEQRYSTAGMMPSYRSGMRPAYPARRLPGFAPAVMPAYYAGPPVLEPAEIMPENGTGKSPRRAEIKILQQKLKEMGYYQGSVSGRIGSRTKSAVKKLQKDFGRPVDGVVDRFVWAAIGVNK